MLKGRYFLSQESGCCGLPGNFAIHELPTDDPRNDQESGFSELNFTPQQNVGKFEETLK